MDTFILTIVCDPRWGLFPWLPLVWIGLWVVVAFVFFRGFRRRRWWAHRPEAVLAELYAKGEISETEYRSRRDVLRERS
jgi:putative membrane protein